MISKDRQGQNAQCPTRCCKAELLKVTASAWMLDQSQTFPIAFDPYNAIHNERIFSRIYYVVVCMIVYTNNDTSDNKVALMIRV